MTSGDRKYRPRSGEKDRAFLAAIAVEDVGTLCDRLVRMGKAGIALSWKTVAIRRAIARAVEREASALSRENKV